MKITKMFLMLIVVMFLALPAWGSGIPEFDAVGIDANNTYAQDLIYQQIIMNGQSNQCADLPGESFTATAGPVDDVNPCNGQMSVMTAPNSRAEYMWTIMLQAQPDSDINLKIIDCIECADCGQSSFWNNAAEQTGRDTWSFLGRVWVPGANPSITVRAHPGAYAEPGFYDSFVMDARMIPGLRTTDVCNTLYTSKGNFAETLVLVRPGGGICGANGSPTSQLMRGDKISVEVTIPRINNQRIYYGPDECILEYVGVSGTDIQ